MTPDEPDEQLDPLSATDEAKVRALLSGARETAPMPADVVARLDRTLAGLGSERVAAAAALPGDVVPLARVRRHRVMVMLGAAAAVVVLGIGVGTVLQQSGGDDMGDASGDSFAERGDDDGALAEGPAREQADDENAPTDGRETLTDDFFDADRAYVVRSRHLSRDLTRIQDLVLPRPATADYARGLVHAPQGFACQIGGGGAGILVGVRYDGDPAFVSFRQPMGDAQVVDVLQCGTGDLLRSTTLPTAG